MRTLAYDDVLGLIKVTPRRIKAIKKELLALFKRYILKVNLDANLRIVNFLDATLNLDNGSIYIYGSPRG